MKFNLKYLLVLVAVYLVYTALFTKEGFHTTKYSNPGSLGSSRVNNDRHWWLPRKGMRSAHPWMKPRMPYGFEPSEEAATDMSLARLYRQLHNTEAIARIDVFQDPTHAHPGGGDGTDKRFWLGEQLDRERMLIQKKIRDDIGFRRRPWSDAYADDVPHTALGGNFYDCHLGDCQWDLDYDEKILGIPSTVGTRHAYY